MMRYTIFLVFVFLSITSNAQLITLNELLFFQTVKDPIKIDSVMLTKSEWDCVCVREYDNMELVNEWVIGLEDTTIEYIRKDHIRVLENPKAYSSSISFLTTDPDQINLLLNEFSSRNYTEKVINEGIIEDEFAKVSFFVSNKIAVQTSIKRSNQQNLKLGWFIFMNVEDYRNGLMIK